jgi:hypothetical protein
MGMGGKLHASVALPPGLTPGTHCIGGWVGPRAGLDGCEQSRPHRDFFNKNFISIRLNTNTQLRDFTFNCSKSCASPVLTKVSGTTKSSSRHKLKLLVNETFPKIDTRHREIVSIPGPSSP